MTTTESLSPPRGFQGEVLTPHSRGYDEARLVWNRAIDRYPAMVLRCTTARDVQLALALARDTGLLVAVRGGGHSMAGLSTCDDGMVIDLSPMKGLTVDPARRIAEAGPGLVWGELDRATQEHGLATPGGEVSDTGIAGLTLGGGIGWLSRRAGLACDNLRAATMVTADGDVVRVSQEDNSDLFWGLRGAGANFGIVTELQYDLVPVGPTVYGGETIHPGFKDVEALRFLVDLAPSLPDDARVMAALVTAPPEPFVPAEARGKPVCVLVGAHCGEPERGAEVLAPLRSFGPPVVDTMRPMPYVELQSTVDKTIPPGRRAYTKSDFLASLDDRALAVLAEHHARTTSPFNQILLHQMGGAIARVSPDATAFRNRNAAWMVTIAAMWVDSSDSGEEHMAWAQGLWEALRPWSQGTYVNHLGDEGEARVREAYGASYARLATLKRQWDPDNVFRLNQNIAPDALC